MMPESFVGNYHASNDPDDISRLQFLRRVTELNTSSWTSTTLSLASAARIAAKLRLKDTVVSSCDTNTRAWGKFDDDHLVHIICYAMANTAQLEVIGPRARLLAERLIKRVPPLPAVPEGDVPVTFWTMSPHGPQGIRRMIQVQEWLEIEQNYSADARQALAELMSFKPTDANFGRICLMFGPSGTGKTTAIRALASAWADWCEVAYITDPDVLFENTPYLFDLLLRESESDRWRLLIIEDAEEFLTPDAKSRVGQGVARLLNTGDGLICAGTKILILLTTNVSVSSLNEAITRPGRCLANIEVPNLTPVEASRWLDRKIESEKSLAELFEIQRNNKQITSKAKNITASGQYL